MDALRLWAGKAKDLLKGPPLTRPKALLLAGLPGTGKGACTRALARHLESPLLHFDALTDAAHLGEVLETVRQSEPCVLWIDGLNPHCHALARWLSLHDEIPGLVVGTTDEPHQLGSALTRAGVFDEVFHLDLPDSSGRASIWDAVLKRFGLDPVSFDNVRLAQATGLFTPGEVMACVKRAVNSSERIDERSLLEPIGRISPIGHREDEKLALIRRWAKVHALPAA